MVPCFGPKRDIWPQTSPEVFDPKRVYSPISLPLSRTSTGMDYVSIPQPTAGPLSADLIPHETNRCGSFFAKVHATPGKSYRNFLGKKAAGSSREASLAAKRAMMEKTAKSAKRAMMEWITADAGEGKEEEGETRGTSRTQSARVPQRTQPTPVWVNHERGLFSADQGLQHDARDDEGNCHLCGFPEPGSTSDHRQQGSTKTPEWKTHVMKWLGEAVKSIPAYVERSTIVLVRTSTVPQRDKKEYDRRPLCI